MNVYTTKFMGITVHSTARKAVESVQYGTFNSSVCEWCNDTQGWTTTEKGRQIDMENKTEADIKWLIAELNKEGFITFDLGGCDSETVEKHRII